MSDLAVTLDGLAAFIRRYVVLTEAQLVAVVLWVAHTHAIEAAEQSLYLAITSATKRSGKTRLLDVLELVVARAWRLISPSEAVVFRKLSAHRPTMLLDEVDAIWSGGRGADNHEGLRALLNAGNRRGTVVSRCVGPQHSLTDFEVFGPKALAGIGRLPDTVADRSIPIRLRRKTPTESAARFRQREAVEAAEPIRISLASLMEQLTPQLAEARPALPEINDRAVEGWEPLLAIAHAAGGDWPQRAWRAAVELSGNEDDDDNEIGPRLLADIRAAFDAHGTDRIATAALLVALADDDEAPWATWHRGEPMRAIALARLLGEFGIKSRSIRLDDGTTPKGYMRESFEDAWLRYLTPEPDTRVPTIGSQNAIPPQSASRIGSRDAYVSATNDSVADTQQPANPHERRDVAPWRIGTLNLDGNGPRAAGDVGFLNIVRRADRAGHLTHDEYRLLVALHGFVRHRVPPPNASPQGINGP